jgi:predicted metalloprotease with PDZ domain
MSAKRNELERPVLGYVVVTVALLTGLATANAFAQHNTDVTTAKLQNEKPATEASSPKQLTKPRRQWILGVRADTTQTGYLIEQVQHPSAASKAGLEAGDRLICVNGHQVGHVGGQVVSLARTLDRAGNRNGYVQLLVQNRRNQRLVVVDAKLHRPLHLLGH